MHIDTDTMTPLAHPILQACKRIGVAKTSIFALIKAGQLRSIKIGSRTLIPESELQRFISDRLKQSST